MGRIVPTRADRFGLAKPAVEAHTLGICSVQQLLADCGFEALVADAQTCQAFGQPEDPNSLGQIERWIRQNRITLLGFSYRLDPQEGAALFARLFHQLRCRGLLIEQGGPLKGVYFAGLPAACEYVQQQVADVAGVFCGYETPLETLERLGIDRSLLPAELARGTGYDQALLEFGKDLIRSGKHAGLRAADHSGYEGFGTRKDTLVKRLEHSRQRGLLPLTRAHVGPYLPDRTQAVDLFLQWAHQLAQSGYLDVLSIGTSQLTQSAFGEDWTGRANGGGVPINCPTEFAAAWQAARPMLVRTYAGTRNVPELARLYEETISNAWHALSLWWFSQIDGRGPNTVRENLHQHVRTLQYVASVGKPFEPNIPHHFAFRGGDDVTCVVSGVLAARLAKKLGIRHLVLQVMLNTPRYTWGVQDLAKARALLEMVRRLEDENFRVILQPRAGLDYFCPDIERAKAQLAAVTALMDDIEPHNPLSPPLIHVVSYSEGSHLASPPVINESIQITLQALREYRRLRSRGQVDDMSNHPEVSQRAVELTQECEMVVQAIESLLPDVYSPQGLYQVLAKGFLVVPYLWECREEFREAMHWSTRIVRGSVKPVDSSGMPVPVATRMKIIAEATLPRQETLFRDA